MSRIPTPATIADAPELSRKRLEAVHQQLGVVPNMFRLIATSPQALEGYLGLSGVHGRSGKAVDAAYAHVWDVADGKIQRFRQYIDTLAIAEARQ